MTRLSVNINKIATLRNARGGNTPMYLMLQSTARTSVQMVLQFTPGPMRDISDTRMFLT